MFCSKCGKQVRENDRFCPNCGAKIIKSNAVAKVNSNKALVENSVQQYTAMQPQYTIQPQPVITVQQKPKQKTLNNNEKKSTKKKANTVPEVILSKVQYESRDLDVVQLSQGPTQKAVRFVEGAAVFVAILLISIFSIIFFVTPVNVLTGQQQGSVDVFTYAFFGDQSLIQTMMNIHDVDSPLSTYFPYLLLIAASVATIIGSIATVFYGLAAFIRYMSGRRGRSIVPIAIADLTVNMISILMIGFFGNLTVDGFSLYAYNPGIEMQAAMWSGLVLVAAVAIYKIVISYRVYLMPTNLLRTIGFVIGIVVGVCIVTFGAGIGLHVLIPFMVPLESAVEGQTPLFIVGCYAIVILLLLITIAAANMARKCMSAIAAENSHGYTFRLYSYFYSIRDYCTTTWLLAIGAAVLLVIMNFFIDSQLGNVLNEIAGGNYFDNVLLILIFAILGVVISMVCNGLTDTMKERDAEYIADCLQRDEAEQIGLDGEDFEEETDEEEYEEEQAPVQSIVVQPIVAQATPSPIVIAPIAQPMQPIQRPLNEDDYVVTDVPADVPDPVDPPVDLPAEQENEADQGEPETKDPEAK